MTKYKVTFTYSNWENGNGWKVEGAYMGIDDKITDDNDALNYTKEDLIADMIDYVSDDIADYNEDDGSDTRYDYTVYAQDKEGNDNEVYSVSVWLSDLAQHNID